MDTLLFFDRWILRYWLSGSDDYNRRYNREDNDYKQDLANALAFYPHVRAFCKHKAPECTKYIDQP